MYIEKYKHSNWTNGKSKLKHSKYTLCTVCNIVFNSFRSESLVEQVPENHPSLERCLDWLLMMVIFSSTV